LTTHVVCLSGGKDSTAMALKLAEAEPRDYQYIITPTGDELPTMKDHWHRLEAMLEKPLTVVSPKYGLAGLMREHRALPNFRMRFCTRSLKIIPYQAWLMKRLPAVSYVGLRADEEGRAGIEWDDPRITNRYPLREWGWGIDEVLWYLKDRHVKIPARTDCARCYAQTLHEWWLLRHDYPLIWESAIADEDRTGHTFRSEKRDTWPASLRELGQAFDIRGEPKQRKRGGGCRICSL